jgi:ferredoxin
LESKFHFVDEPTCIGCTWCADVARNTFTMESELGRGRVFRQHGDSIDVIKEAMECCPVNAIHSVTWEQLVSSEKRREEHSRLASGNPGHLYHLPGQGIVRSRSYAESRGQVIVGRVTTDQEEREREVRTSKIREEERRAILLNTGLPDVPNLESKIDAIMTDPCEQPDAPECTLLGLDEELDPCAVSPHADGCATATGRIHAAFDPALVDAPYVIEDPCDADPLGDECQVIAHAGDQRLYAQIDYDMDGNFEVGDDLCQVEDAPSFCEDDNEAEKLIAIYRNAAPSFA